MSEQDERHEHIWTAAVLRFGTVPESVTAKCETCGKEAKV